MPITWRNVGATIGAGDAARLFRGATDSIGGGLNKLTGAIRQVEQNREDKAEFEGERQTDDFLDYFSKLKTTDELIAAQESGEVDRLRASLGPNVNRDEVRNAANNAMSRLRGQEIAGAQHELTLGELEDDTLLRGVRPVEEQIAAFNETGQFDKARELADQNKQKLIDAGRWNEALGSVRENQERVQDRGETLAQRNENAIQRNRNRATRTAADYRSNAVNNSPDDSAFARQMYLDRVEVHNANNPDNKIPADVVATELNQLDNEWKQRWGLTDTQLEDHQQFSEMVDQAAQRAIGHERANLEALEEQIAPMISFAWNDEKKVSVGDVQQQMRGGMDGNENLVITTDENEIQYIEQLLDQEIEDAYKPTKQVEVDRRGPGNTPFTAEVQNELHDPNRDWGVEARENKGAILKEVAKRLSGDNSWLTRLDGVDVRQSNKDIKNIVDSVLADFQESRRREEDLRNARNQARIRENLIMGQISSAKTAELEKYKALNRSIGSQ